MALVPHLLRRRGLRQRHLRRLLRRRHPVWCELAHAWPWHRGWLTHAPGETRAYVPGVLGRLPQADMYDAPVPGIGRALDGSSGPWSGYSGRGPLFQVEGRFTLHDQQGCEMAAPVKTTTSAAVPYGAR